MATSTAPRFLSSLNLPTCEVVKLVVEILNSMYTMFQNKSLFGHFVELTSDRFILGRSKDREREIDREREG